MMSETECIAKWVLPSPEGRGWIAAGAFTSRRGPGEGSVTRRRGIRQTDITAIRGGKPSPYKLRG